MWDQLKSIIRQTSDKAVIIEDGEPRFVVLTVKEYNRLHDIVEGKTDAKSESVLSEETEQQGKSASDLVNAERVENSAFQDQDYEKVNQELSLEIDETARQQAEKMLRPELNTESIE